MSKLLWVAILVLWLVPKQIMAQTAKTQNLELQQTITSQLLSEQTHTYEMTLSGGQFVSLEIESDQFIPILSLLNTNTQLLIERQFMRSPVKSKLLYRIPQTARYRVTVFREKDLQPEARPYKLTARVIAQPDAQELAYAKGLLLQKEIWPLYSQGSKESLNQLLIITQEAIQISRQLQEREWEANALTYTAEAYKAQEKFDLALEYFQQALLVIREIGVPARIAGALTPIGQIYYAWGDYQKALEYYLQALPLLSEQRDPHIVGWNLINIGNVYRAYGELPQAIEYYQRAFAAYGQYQGPQNEKPLGQGVAMSGMANVSFALGEKQIAIKYQQQALEQFKIARSATNEFLAYARLGEMFAALGEYQQAEFYLNKSLAHFKDTHNLYEANVLSRLGDLAKKKGEHETALSHLNAALAIRRNLKERRGTAECLTVMGEVLAQQGQMSSALHQFTEAQQIWQEIGDKLNEGRVLNRLGQVYVDSHKFDEARVVLQKSLTLRRSTQDREGEAETLYQLARVETNQRNYASARQQMEHVLTIVESVRATIENQELRASYLATVQKYYEFYVDLLMQLHRRHPTAGHDREALQANEMARARTLRETLSNTHRQLRQNVAPELLQRETALQQRLNAKAEYQRKLSSQKAKLELLNQAAQEIQSITAELQEARTAITNSNQRYASLAQTQPLSVSEMQQSLLDENTLLLVYALGEERSYLWLVSSTKMSSFELPNRANIETVARRVYELLLPQQMSNQATLNQSLSELQQMILAPVHEQLEQKRLLIVADGALQYIPFAALPAPEFRVSSSAFREQAEPLITKHEIVTLPSINSLAIIRRELIHRTPAPKTIAVFADPVFSTDDPRLLNAKGKKKSSFASPDLEQALRDIDRDIGEDGVLRRLPFSRREAEAIIDLVPPEKRKIALDFSANRANTSAASLRDYRVLHFATHGILNSAHPELSGLVLSLVNERGQSQDGFFRLHEIYNLRLNAELVVLSACQTGLGKDIKGEGLIGLTRGFMYAGAPRVMASLWKVNDKATSELMKHFYQAHFGESKQSVVAALRSAQLALQATPRWSHPSYWAAFTVQGEWK